MDMDINKAWHGVKTLGVDPIALKMTDADNTVAFELDVGLFKAVEQKHVRIFDDHMVKLLPEEFVITLLYHIPDRFQPFCAAGGNFS